MENKNKRISFSELKTWTECSYKHKLVYTDGNRWFKGNEFTAFGTAIHHLCEKKVLNESENDDRTFLDKFADEISKVEISNNKNVPLMEGQYKQISLDLMNCIEENFAEYEVLAVEEELFEPMNLDFASEKTHFKGYVDLILKTPDGKHHIIDWKSCSWGWNRDKRSDKVLGYQLLLYKKYYSEKYNIELKNIETHFGLLKRTANKNSVEIFRITSGPRKMQNCLNLLEKALKNIDKGCYIKNRLSCRYCEFYKTELCT